MKPQILFSSLADAAATRYGLITEAWRYLYDQALNDRDFGAPRQFLTLQNNAYAIARDYLAGEGEQIATGFESIVSEALTATSSALGHDDSVEASEALSEHLSASQHYLLRELTIQIERDVAYLKDALRRTVLQVKLAAEAKGVPLHAALIQHRIGDASQLNFFFHDRRNAKWPSRKFVRGVWRHALLSAYNDAVLMTLAEHGEQSAQILHLDAKAPAAGMIIAMQPGAAWPSYAEIRHEIFHPNSDAIVVRRSDADPQ